MKYKILKIIAYLIYILFWTFTAVLTFILYNYAVFSCFEDLYGQWSLWLGLFIAVVILLSPIYLRLFIQNKWLVPLIALAISVIFLIGGIGLYKVTIIHFKEFTPAKWDAYPRQRIVMLDNLKEKYNIIGMSKSEVEIILGKPDEITDKNSIIYSYEFGYIEFVCTDDVISSINEVDYF